jgi:hypothetical protein
MSQSNASRIHIHCNSSSSFSNLRAWDLLRRVLDEKPYVQSHLPFDIVNWVTDESRREISTTLPSNVDEIELEVQKFRKRLESEDLSKIGGQSDTWTMGWKKWEGEWTPRPIGV